MQFLPHNLQRRPNSIKISKFCLKPCFYKPIITACSHRLTDLQMHSTWLCEYLAVILHEIITSKNMRRGCKSSRNLCLSVSMQVKDPAAFSDRVRMKYVQSFRSVSVTELNFMVSPMQQPWNQVLFQVMSHQTASKFCLHCPSVP